MSAISPRRTTVELERALDEAVSAELSIKGYSGVSFEAVARRAGTSKPVLYRRYRSRAHMVVHALRSNLAVKPTAESSGSLRDDLVRWLSAARDRAAEVGDDTYRALLGEADEQLLCELSDLLGDSAADLERFVFGPARRRGELRAGRLPDVLATLPVVLLRNDVIFGRIGDVDVADVVDTICMPLLRSTVAP